MKLNATIFRLLPLLALLQAGLYSCDTIHEDLPPLPSLPAFLLYL